MQHPMLRRSFFKRAAALLAGAAASLVSQPLALAAPNDKEKEKEYPYYILDPEHGAGTACPVSPAARHAASQSCHGCQACHSHGANKLFLTAQAADQGRAHKHCKCLVRQGGTLPQGTYVALFGPVGKAHRSSVDRRHQRTRSILKNAS